MRRSRKPLSVVRRIEGSNPSPSASQGVWADFTAQTRLSVGRITEQASLHAMAFGLKDRCIRLLDRRGRPYGPWRVASDQGETTVRVVTTGFELFVPVIETAPLGDESRRSAPRT